MDPDTCGHSGAVGPTRRGAMCEVPNRRQCDCQLHVSSAEGLTEVCSLQARRSWQRYRRHARGRLSPDATLKRPDNDAVGRISRTAGRSKRARRRREPAPAPCVDDESLLAVCSTHKTTAAHLTTARITPIMPLFVRRRLANQQLPGSAGPATADGDHPSSERTTSRCHHRLFRPYRTRRLSDRSAATPSMQGLHHTAAPTCRTLPGASTARGHRRLHALLWSRC
ncbi:hypothetical protein M409DRAFT_57051 [Zasmidium cellare ATCC 36951]|uniref:Uncharacterized protein n=1 Tax=Zasmidium cellare ATCC 36951 TaxID=1080233 RepID=A0A6A6CA98_ZASCE|nr:uncharacterized protein M409DRAFT_57051 [Zasmidium cellare ATCC 36951]KAF2163945.1 hypothetical protein M409DRAFT_57051 [Zasmidium cellare ATCC 36951]